MIDTTNSFLKWFCRLKLSLAICENPIFLHCHHHLVLLFFFGHSLRYKMVSHWSFDLHFSNDKWCKAILYVYGLLGHPFFVKCLFKIFVHFKWVDFFFSFWLLCLYSLYILNKFILLHVYSKMNFSDLWPVFLSFSDVFW